MMNALEEWYDRRTQKELEQNAWKVAFAARRHRRLLLKIHDYFIKRELRWPTMEQALQWAHTESGEVTEQLLARQLGWVRNNPEKQRDGSDSALMKEIADQVFMLLIAGMVEGYDILDIMQDKMERKLKEHAEKS